ncbi:MAG: MmgE/PrpD family protein [Alicyclobacillaceae bacterium]|nr:MmgE/PrpD family protein [Alicyclobacillaceae bacterium]
MSVLECLAEHLAAVQYDEISEGAKIALADHWLDTVAAMIGGAFTDDGRQLLSFQRASGPRWGVADGAAGRVWLRSALTRLTEVDDIHRSSCTTPGSIVIPAALTVAGIAPEADVSRLCSAVLAGYELVTRLGQAIDGTGVLYRGIWPTYFCAAFGAAATAARLLGLNTRESAYALAIALTVSAGGSSPSEQRYPCRWWTLGHAVASGCLAAVAAAHGFKGDLRMLDTPEWMERTYGLHLYRDRLMVPWGRPWALEQVSLKPYCAAKQVISAIEAWGQCLEQGVRPADVEAVRVHVPPSYAAMIDHGITSDVRLSSLTSAPYQLAVRACRPDVLYDVNRRAALDAEEVRTLMEKISVVPCAALESWYPQAWPARVEVNLRHGGAVSAEVCEARGDPAHRLTTSDIEDKWHRILDLHLGRAAVASCLSRIRGALGDGAGLTACNELIEEAFEEAFRRGPCAPPP